MKALGTIAALLIGMVVLSLGIHRNEIERLANDIRIRNARNERESIRKAVATIRAEWQMQGGDWFGRLADGEVIRLEAPQVSVTTLKEGRPLCCRWYGEIAVKADRWDHPGTPEKEPFLKTYTVLVRDSKQVEILDTTGPEVDFPKSGNGMVHGGH
ncbi:MAG: hypothetical protein ABMA01_20040 [Chthoniobacteraceae bacterium]